MLTSNTCIPIQTVEISFPARGTQTELSVTPGGCCLTICVRLCTRRDSGHQLLFFWGSIISPVPASTLAVLNDYVAECGTSEMKACPKIQWWLQSRLLSWNGYKSMSQWLIWLFRSNTTAKPMWQTKNVLSVPCLYMGHKSINTDTPWSLGLA